MFTVLVNEFGHSSLFLDTRHPSWTSKSIYLPLLCSLAIGAKHKINIRLSQYGV